MQDSLKNNYLGKQCKWQATLRFFISALTGLSCKNACWGSPQTPNKRRIDPEATRPVGTLFGM